eukprot:3372537-Pyramimonas_sp.AAC.1
MAGRERDEEHERVLKMAWGGPPPGGAGAARCFPFRSLGRFAIFCVLGWASLDLLVPLSS